MIYHIVAIDVNLFVCDYRLLYIFSMYSDWEGFFVNAPMAPFPEKQWAILKPNGTLTS